MYKFILPSRGGVMKALFVNIYPVFEITAVLTHLWTVIVAYEQGGFIQSIVSLFLPVFSELYWVVNSFGVNDVYAFVALFHLVLAIPIITIRSRIPY
jgi:hypothetical protein